MYPLESVLLGSWNVERQGWLGKTGIVRDFLSPPMAWPLTGDSSGSNEGIIQINPQAEPKLLSAEV